MTKYLVKIISICCFIVLIPVIIAGVALCAVGSTMHKLSVYVVGADNANASYSIFVGEKDKDKEQYSAEKTTFSFLKDAELNINTEIVGYDFQGWFNGDDKVYDPATSVALTTDLAYALTLEKDTQLTAVYKSKTYTLKFQGFYEDGTTEIRIDDKVVKYGDTIAAELKPINENSSVILKGWKVANQAIEVGTTATFETSGTYILEPIWSNRTKINFMIKEGTEEAKVVDFVYLTEEELKAYELPTMANEKIAAVVGEGYEFVRWENEAGVEVTSADIQNMEFNTQTVTNVYLKRNIINYTLKVSNGLDQAETIDVNFNVNDMFGAINFTKTRIYYSVVGLKVGATSYYANGDNYFDGNNRLSTFITDGNEKTIEAEAIWACDYQKLFMTFSALCNDFSVYGRANADAEPTLLVADIITGQDSQTYYFAANDEGHQVYNLEDNMFNTIFPESYVEYCVPGDEDGTWETVTLKEVKVYYNGLNSVIISKLEQADFAYALDLILEKVPNYDFTSANIEVEFVFA